MVIAKGLRPSARPRRVRVQKRPSPAADLLLSLTSIRESVLVQQVMILSRHGLFRDGLHRVLSEVASVISVSTIQEAEQMARSRHVDVVLVDQNDDETSRDNTIARLLAIPNLKVVVVSLDTYSLRIYIQSRVQDATVEDLLAAIIE